MQLHHERRLLKVLAPAPHIVRMVSFPNNPLAIIDHEIIMTEYLEYGTLNSFVLKSRQMNIVLPNRLLWSFFGCLLQATAALAYPEQAALGKEFVPVTPKGIGAVPSLLQHNDLHDKNILLGEPAPDDRLRGFAPILKWVDFGLAGYFTGANHAAEYGVRGNLRDVGEIMICLLTREQWCNRRIRQSLTVNDQPGLTAYETEAVASYPSDGHPDPCAGLDADFRAIVSLLCSRDRTRCPRLLDVMEFVNQRIGRNAAYYNNAVEEQDATRSRLWQHIVNAPSTAPETIIISS
ncbi:hypothetical protein F5Y15DRAFT_99199 [Xylariaceae sp. FL0016]|nr:hypothetical protein F5Y15DRAFT_99199 [Xylariaceae sp. FL0016]